MVTPEGVYGMYLGDLSERSKIRSPLPDRYDPNPSFAFNRNSEGELLWIDFGRATRRGGDCISFVCEMFGLSRRKAVEKIWDDFKTEGTQIKVVKATPRRRKSCTYGALEQWELAYWKDYYLHRPDLHRFKVFGNRGFWSDDSCLAVSLINEPSYVYIDGSENYKVYTPHKSDFGKWFSHGVSGVIECYDQLECGGDDVSLILCSGRKDAMVTWKMGQVFFGGKIQVIAPTTERSKTAILRKLPEIINRYPNRYSLMDFDSTGWAAMRDWKEHFKPIRLEPSWNHKIMLKDVADLAKYRGLYYLYLKVRNKN